MKKVHGLVMDIKKTGTMNMEELLSYAARHTKQIDIDPATDANESTGSGSILYGKARIFAIVVQPTRNRFNAGTQGPKFNRYSEQ